MSYGGYVANIKMTNVRAKAEQRVGGLIGHVYESITPLTVDRISLINTDSDYVIQGEGKSARAGGIIGFIQTNGSNSAKARTVDVTVTNCFVNANIGSDTSGENGGIIGTYDTDYESANFTHILTISQCYSVATVKANTRCGGILGYYKGLHSLRIYGCISLGNLYHANAVEPLTSAQKNASCIVGGYSASGDARVSWCYAKFAEHNTNYGVEVIDTSDMEIERIWSENMGFDLENTWKFDETTSLVVTLR
jgi:hypothetical protein